uniref:Uncharacterized protein n=1 Tax=Calidris pygmaea TaxID=425635 RepID=A0A8C3JJS6_9CHAR
MPRYGNESSTGISLLSWGKPFTWELITTKFTQYFIVSWVAYTRNKKFCFLSGSRELPSNNSLFLIPSLSILCRILCWAKLYLQ